MSHSFRVVTCDSTPSQTSLEEATKPALVNVGENLNRVHTQGNRSGKPTGKYYALDENVSKQFRGSPVNFHRRASQAKVDMFLTAAVNVCRIGATDEVKTFTNPEQVF